MKTINLKGVSNTLSDNEMKMVKGGGDTTILIPPAPPEDIPCAGLAAGSECSVTWSGGVKTGHCYYPKGSSTLKCSA